MYNSALAELKHHIRLFERLGDALESQLADTLEEGFDPDYEERQYRAFFHLGKDLPEWDCQILPGLTFAIEADGSTHQEAVHIVTFNMCVKDAAGDHIGVDLVYASNMWNLKADEYAHSDHKNRPHPAIYIELLRRLNLQPGEHREVSRREAFTGIRSFIDICYQALEKKIAWAEGIK